MKELPDGAATRTKGDPHLMTSINFRTLARGFRNGHTATEVAEQAGCTTTDVHAALSALTIRQLYKIDRIMLKENTNGTHTMGAQRAQHLGTGLP